MTIALSVHARLILIAATASAALTTAYAAEQPSSAAAQPASARVEFFSPQGTTRQVRQATARFTTPIVALGDPRLPDPFTVECPSSGQGRWADTRNWVYDFAADLPAGVACRFTLRPGLKALDGRKVTQATFRFDTGGPAIVASYPYEGWSALDEDQIFLLKLDAPATAASIREHAYCVIEGLAERIPLRVLMGDERSKVLEQRSAIGYAYYDILWKSGRTSQARVRDRSLEEAEAQIVVAVCGRPLPPATRVQLVWGAGIGAASGIATKQDQQVAFRVRAPFTAQVECSRVNAESGCIPFQPISVRFSAPIAFETAQRIELRGPEGKKLPPTPPPASKTPMVEEVRFNGPFPDAQKLTVVLPPDLRDDAGRALENAARFPLEIDVDEYPPLVKFSGEFGILEAREGGVLPVTLRNVEDEAARRQKLPARKLKVPADPGSIATWLRKVEEAARPKGEWRTETPSAAVAAANGGNASYWYDMTGTQSVFASGDQPESFAIDKPLGKRPAEVIGIPLGKSGLHVVEIESRTLGSALLGRDEPRYVATSALVTNLSVHFLWGRETSQAWVTQLDSGRPVAGAKVVVTDFCSGEKRWEGQTGVDGLARIDVSFGSPHDSDRCESWRHAPLLVTAQSNDDLSFALSGWSQGIAPHDFGLGGYGSDDPSLYHTVLDRPLFRAGETVSMKHFLRRHEVSGVGIQAQLPAERRVTIAHQGSDQRYELKAQFGADGIAEQQWTIPKEARLGDYLVNVQGPKGELYNAGRFKVEEYRLPTMRATVQGPPRPLVNARSADLDLHVAYLSGGGAGGLPVTVRTMVEPRPCPIRATTTIDSAANGSSRASSSRAAAMGLRLRAGHRSCTGESSRHAAHARRAGRGARDDPGPATAHGSRAAHRRTRVSGRRTARC